MSKMAIINQENLKKSKKRLNTKVNDEETTRLDKLKVGRKNFS